MNPSLVSGILVLSLVIYSEACTCNPEPIHPQVGFCGSGFSKSLCHFVIEWKTNRNLKCHFTYSFFFKIVRLSKHKGILCLFDHFGL